MRKLKHLVLLLTTIFLTIFSSCSSSDDGGDGGEAPSGLLIANVAGKPFQSFELSSSATITTTGVAKSLMIIATNSDGQGFSMTIFGYEGAGTYEFTGANVAITNVATYSETDVNLSNPIASTTELWQAPYDETLAGSISISEETETKVIGTFSFKGKNVGGDGSIMQITEGSFNLNKQTF
ncbi:hypothetical protein APS56_13495 [Pseudalgibacter alginicilyticus]|uniref:Lipocalin-like domain-containing protein n=1 Tax=Pseudalgibacter alginicilyticus TaxID=1736674 RepID=A0A0P0DD43_9FLAO|nr:DUF6252 family protein [Pseudalgibacter alginicilyticus]ALJ06083.1 hypothetical protein APS56_13495 [Pseudalgibacter alginicilyticus]